MTFGVLLGNKVKLLNSKIRIEGSFLEVELNFKIHTYNFLEKLEFRIVLIISTLTPKKVEVVKI